MAHSWRNMPAAIPGIGECNICFEVVPCLKVLDCGHCLCIQCANRLSESGSKSSITCPECRKETDCSRGLSYLNTRYFGKIRCDVCLEKKEAEDMWWCSQCFQALCSKCSIKEHSNKSHTITEWNKFEPVKCSVSFLNEVKYARQLSSAAEHNRKAVGIFMNEVGKKLEKSILEQPELDELKENLLTRYGTRFSSDETSRESTSSGGSDQTEFGPKVVAKVLQLAGANIMETVLPTVNEQKFQVYFTVTPEDVAEYLKSKIQFIPLEDESKGVASPQTPAAPAATDSMVTEEAFTGPEIKMPVLQVGYNPKEQVVALRTATEVQIHSLSTRKNHSIPMPANQAIRSMLLDQKAGGELLLVLQSMTRKYEWSVEAYQTSTVPVTSVYSAPFDTDPEDKVEGVHLALSTDGGTLFEVRLSAGNVSEVWKAVCSKKKGKTKFHETLVYEKPGARFTALEVVEPKQGKEKFLFCWDELSSCLYRLIVKNGRCEVSTKLMHSSEPIPFRLDTGMCLWLFDPHMSSLCVSRGSVLGRVNVMFSEVLKFGKHGFCGIWLVHDSVIGINVDGNCIRRVIFKKSET